MITHAVDIRATACIRLRRQHSPICILRHTNHVGHHHPFGGIDIAVPHPASELLWINASNERKIAKHHQALDVMRVRPLIHAIQHRFHARHRRLRRISKHWRKLHICRECIHVGVVGHPLPVTVPDVFAPANDLPNKPFRRIQRHLASAKCRLRCFNYFARQK